MKVKKIKINADLPTPIILFVLCIVILIKTEADHVFFNILITMRASTCGDPLQISRSAEVND